jgi:hypothetical protein
VNDGDAAIVSDKSLPSFALVRSCHLQLRELEAKKRAIREAADPEMANREGGYGGFHQEKTYEANVSNPFKEVRDKGLS